MIPPYEAIRNLLGTYCWLIDSGDFEALGQLFADGELLDERGRVAARGAEAATALWSGMVRRYADGTPRTRHVTTNPVIELADDGTAVCRSSFVVHQLVGGRLEAIAAGRYCDMFASDDEGIWRFTSRQFFLDQLGDVSQHMVEA